MARRGAFVEMSQHGRETGCVERAQRTRVNVCTGVCGRHASAHVYMCVFYVWKPVDSEVSDGSSS